MAMEAILETAAAKGREGDAAGSAQAPRSVDDYLSLPYTVRVTADPTGGFVAAVEELPGCVTQGESWAEIGEMVQDTMRA